MTSNMASLFGTTRPEAHTSDPQSDPKSTHLHTRIRSHHEQSSGNLNNADTDSQARGSQWLSICIHENI